MSQVTVVAKAKARPGLEQKLEDAVRAIIEPTRREEGCLEYSLFQADDDATTFLTVEKWATKEAHERHLVSPHIQELLKKLPDILAEMPDIRVFNDVTKKEGIKNF